MTSVLAHSRRGWFGGPRLTVAAVASLTAFSAAAVGAGLGRALVTTYLPVLLDDIRDAPGLIGTVMLVNTAAGLAVPLLVGLWSDRLHARGRSRSGPFIVGGSVLAAGGLAGIALGHASTYLLLALVAAITYTGLNAIVTAHRALIPETFDDDARASATGAEEFGLLLGTLVGVVAGGFLLELAPPAPFAFGAVLLPLLAWPTYRRMRGREQPRRREPDTRQPWRYYLRAASAPRARLVLSAQLLWVLGYIGLPPFFILYADHELGLRPSAAASLLAVFGLATGAAMLGAGSVRMGYQPRMLALGIVLLGGGLLAAAATTELHYVAPALLAAAVGFGLVTTLGYPLFTRFTPPGEEGAHAALYFATRSLAGAVAVPAAGWTIAVAGSYRALLVSGGAVALTALVPLARLNEDCTALRRPRRGRALALAGGLATLCSALLAGALLIAGTRLSQFDADLFDALYGLGGTPDVLDRLLVDPHIQNYVALTLGAIVVATIWRPDELARVLALVPLTGLASFAVVRLLWAIWDRPRPEEVLGVEPANGHLFAPHASFPSGHVVVTVALVTAIASRIPWLGPPLALYAAVIAVTRVSYGAHFPFDVAAGVVIGIATARVIAALLTETRLLPLPPTRHRRGAVSERMPRHTQAVALAAGIVTVLGFAVLALTVGPPRSPEGGIVPGTTEATLQYALLGLSVAALVVALRWPGAGGSLLIVAAGGLGMLAGLEYDPLFAAGAFVLFFAPGALLALGASWRRGIDTSAVLAVLTAFVFLTGFGALGVHASAFGPTHPESRTAPLPVTLVRWSWAGGVTESSFRVVAKLTRDGDARLLVSRSPTLSAARASLPQRASHDDNDRIVSFAISGLEPGRRYYYALAIGDTVDRVRVGRVQTLTRTPTSFTIAFSGCARVGSNGAVFDAIRKRNPLLFLILGDFFYANIDTNDTEAFRNQYDRALSQPAQAALYASTPIAYVWDDHDFGGNDSDSTAASKPAALETYRAAVPHYRLPTGAIYQSFTVGRVRFLLTDTRSLRTDWTMLGAAQKAWLKRELIAAKRRGELAVWISSVPWISSEGADTWAGYPAERRELAGFVARNGIRNLVMLSGDAHMVAIDDGRNNRYAPGRKASFPVIHAAALDRRGDVKGGPFSEGVFPGSGQFGTITVDDRGDEQVNVVLAGWSYRGERLVEYAFTRKLGIPRQR